MAGPRYAFTDTENGELAVTVHLPALVDASTMVVAVGRAGLRCEGPAGPPLRVALPCAVDPTTARAKWRPELRMLHVTMCRVEPVGL